MTAVSGNRLVPLACLLGAGALIGLSTNLAKIAAQAGLGALAFLTWSVLGGALALIAVNASRGRLPRLDRRTVEYFFVSALVSIAAPQLILFAAVPRVGAGFVALSLAFPPLFTYVGALLLRMERFDALRAAGVVLALAGALLLALRKMATPDAQTFWIVATLVAPVLLAVGNIYRTRRWPPGAAPDALAPGMLAASVGWLGFAAALPGFSLHVPFDDAVPALLIGVQAAAFAVQYLLFFVLQQRGGPVYLSLLGSVAAIVGVPIAVLLLNEQWPAGLAVGAALITAGIVLVTRPWRR